MKKLITLTILCLALNGTVYAQAKPQAKPQVKPQIQPQGKIAPVKVNGKGDKKADGQATEDKSTDLAIDLKLFGGLGIPLGSINTIGASVGGGGHFVAELRLPFSLGPLQFKAGLSAGFYGFGIQPEITSLNASISLIPILGYAILAYPVKTIGLTPYLGVGGGGTLTGYTIADSTQTASTFDGTLAFRLGAEYSLPPVPKLSIILNLGYMIVFEIDKENLPNNGQLISIDVGVSYRIFGK